MRIAKRLLLGIITFMIALPIAMGSASVASAATATFPGETTWGNWQGSADTSDSPAAAYSSNLGGTMVVYRGNDNSGQLWYSIDFPDFSTVITAIPNATSRNAPSVFALDTGFLVIWRGNDNNNVYWSRFNNFPNSWSTPETVTNSSGSNILTTATPVISTRQNASNLFTIGYRGASSSNLWTVDGTVHHRSDGTFDGIEWSNNLRTSFTSPSAPALASLSNGTIYMAWRAADNSSRIWYSTRGNGSGLWSSARILPGTPTSNSGRPILAGGGSTLDLVTLGPTAADPGRIIRRTQAHLGINADQDGWTGNWDLDPQSWRSYSIPALVAVGQAIYEFLRGARDNVIYMKQLSNN